MEGRQEWRFLTVLVFFSFSDEMQTNSCKVFAKNDLFGTYSEASQAFEFMSYSEFAHKVDLCRSVLKDLGKSGG